MLQSKPIPDLHGLSHLNLIDRCVPQRDPAQLCSCPEPCQVPVDCFFSFEPDLGPECLVVFSSKKSSTICQSFPSTKIRFNQSSSCCPAPKCLLEKTRLKTWRDSSRNEWFLKATIEYKLHDRHHRELISSYVNVHVYTLIFIKTTSQLAPLQFTPLSQIKAGKCSWDAG